MGVPDGSLRHYGIDNDVNGLILMSDIILYGSSQDEQGFPPLLTRAMSFGVPVVAPDYPVIKKYVSFIHLSLAIGLFSSSMKLHALFLYFSKYFFESVGC